MSTGVAIDVFRVIKLCLQQYTVFNDYTCTCTRVEPIFTVHYPHSGTVGEATVKTHASVKPATISSPQGVPFNLLQG